MTPMLAELHRAHVGRLQRFRSRAVPDEGIDFKRPTPNVILRSVVPPQPTIMHVPPTVMIPIQRAHVPPPEPQKVAKVRRPSAFRKTFMIRQIIKHLAERYDVMPQQITSQDRHAIFVTPRFIAMYLAKTVVGQSLALIGRQFSDRDHTTVLNALKKTRANALSDFQFGSELAALECAIRRRNP